jgi:hypothetical protein
MQNTAECYSDHIIQCYERKRDFMDRPTEIAYIQDILDIESLSRADRQRLKRRLTKLKRFSTKTKRDLTKLFENQDSVRTLRITKKMLRMVS